MKKLVSKLSLTKVCLCLWAPDTLRSSRHWTLLPGVETSIAARSAEADASMAASVTSRDVQEIVSKLSSDKAKAREVLTVPRLIPFSLLFLVHFWYSLDNSIVSAYVHSCHAVELIIPVSFADFLFVPLPVVLMPVFRKE